MRFKEYCNTCKYSRYSVDAEPCASCISESAKMAADKIKEDETNIEYYKQIDEPSRYEPERYTDV